MREIISTALFLLIGVFFAVDAAFAQTEAVQQLVGEAMSLANQGHLLESAIAAEKALKTAEKMYGSEHPAVALALNVLAGTQKNLGIGNKKNIACFDIYYKYLKFARAESLYKRALAIAERVFGPDHPNVAIVLNDLALVHYYQKRYTTAFPLAEKAVAISSRTLRPDSPFLATTLNNLALIHQEQGEYAKADILFKKSIAIYKKRPINENATYLASSLENLAGLYRDQGKYDLASLHYNQALEAVRTLDPKHPVVMSILKNLLDLMRKTGQMNK